MIKHGHSVVGCAPNANSEIQDTLAKMGVEYKNIPLNSTGLNPLQDIKAIYAMITLLKKEKPDIVLSYTIKLVLFGSFAAWFTKVPGIFSMITGLGYAFTGRDLKRRIVAAIIRSLCRTCIRINKKVFFQNPDDLKFFEYAGFLKEPEQAILINGSGVDLDYFCPELLPESISFIMIARLIKDKGVIEYIEAARLIKRQYPHILFRLAGLIDKNPASITKEQLNVWIEEGIIDYLGWLNDVRPAIAASSVFVFPSYREGMPRGVLEAMSMGRPIITTDVPGCRETVINGVNGFLVPAQNILSLAFAMQYFINDSNLVSIMGKQSRLIAIDKFDVNKVNNVILKTLCLV